MSNPVTRHRDITTAASFKTGLPLVFFGKECRKIKFGYFDEFAKCYSNWQSADSFIWNWPPKTIFYFSLHLKMSFWQIFGEANGSNINLYNHLNKPIIGRALVIAITMGHLQKWEKIANPTGSHLPFVQVGFDDSAHSRDGGLGRRSGGLGVRHVCRCCCLPQECVSCPSKCL